MLAILIVSREICDPLSIPENFVFIFASVTFLIEFLMNGKGIMGLGGVAYELLGELTLVCAACCLYLSIRPTAFFAEFLLSCGLVMKGTWVLQVGLLLYTDPFGLKGCEKISISPVPGKNDLKCALEGDRLRGMAVVNLVFIGHLIVVLMASFGLFGLLCRNPSMRCGEVSKPLLAELESESMLMRPLPEFDIE